MRPDEYPVLFLDVDGVLNRCSFSAQGLESDKIEQLARIVNRVNPVVVVSSTWRRYPQSMKRLQMELQKMGARFGGVTPILEELLSGGIYKGHTRGDEILAWMKLNIRPSNFVILDDDVAMGSLLPNLIQTESAVGLTEEIADRVIIALS